MNYGLPLEKCRSELRGVDGVYFPPVKSVDPLRYETWARPLTTSPGYDTKAQVVTKEKHPTRTQPPIQRPLRYWTDHTSPSRTLAGRRVKVLPADINKRKETTSNPHLHHFGHRVRQALALFSESGTFDDAYDQDQPRSTGLRRRFFCLPWPR